MKQVGPNAFEATHFTLFCGMGGLSLGLDRGGARIGRTVARMRCLGGVDAWPAAAKSFSQVTGVPATVLDLFSAADYQAFHGRPPPVGWLEATPADIRAAAGGECPDILATSPPCKGFSGLLNPEAAASPRYQALNRLTIRGIALALEAFADDPPSLLLLENVPRIQTRGRELLDVITALLRSHGYAVAETTHDCGELGGLAQHRRRYLMVARHTRKVRPFLYEPPKRRVRGIGEALEQLPMPELAEAGPMHKLPRLEWRTWVRLALIPEGKDWRALQQLPVVDGYLRDIGIQTLGAEWHGGVLGVRPWASPAGTVTGHPSVTCGAHAVADPRVADSGSYQPYGVVPWSQPSRTVTSQAAPGAGPYSVADPRPLDDAGARFSNCYRIVRWGDASPTVTGARGAQAAVADPRVGSFGQHSGKMAVQPWSGPARTVTGTVDVQAGAQAVADPRWTWAKGASGDWSNAGFYGVRRWVDPTGAVTANAKHDTGHWSVADPRPLPAGGDRCVPLIVSLSGKWHRPLTTLELAHLQGYPVFGNDGRPLVIEGADQAAREQIGNSVPVDAARAIGDEVARTLLLEQLGESFVLSAAPIWVQPVAVALSVAQEAVG